MKFRIHAVGVSFSALLCGLTINQASAAEEQAKHAHGKTPFTLRVVTPFATGHILADTALQFKAELEKRAPHIKVEVQSAVLTEQTINPAMRGCKREERVGEIMFTGGQPIQDYAPQYFFVNAPYVVSDFKHLNRVWESRLGQNMIKSIELNGNYVAFAPVYRGFRQFTSNRPINGPEDFVALKLRLPGVPDWISVWSSLGVTPVTVPLTGIYDALKNGTAEASEGDLTQIQSLKLNEVQSRLTLTNHLVAFGMPMANSCFYRGELSRGERKKVNVAMQKSIKWGSEKMKAQEASLQTQLVAAGMTVGIPDAAAIRAAAKPSIDTLFASKWSVTTWDEVLKMQ